MKVHILFSLIQEHVSKYRTKTPELEKFTQEVITNAMKAWESRTNEGNVRFLQPVPTKYGLRFSFFVVTQNEKGDLVVGD